MRVLFLEALFIALSAFLFSYLVNKNKFFSSLNYIFQQIIIGLFYAGIAIFCSHFGYFENDVLLNVRDAAPLVAGLFFGWPSGIIAGTLGGLYRYLGIYWGLGDITALACSIATFLSGIIAGLSRRFLFKNHNPGIVFSIWLSLGCETFHMLLILLTNMNTIQLAYSIVDTIAFIMIGFVTFSVLLTDLLIEKRSFKIKRPLRLRPSFLNSMNISFIFLFLVTGLMTYDITNGIAKTAINYNLIQSLNNSVSILEEDGINESLKTWTVYTSGGLLIYDNKSNKLLSASNCGTEIDVDTVTFLFKNKPEYDYDLYNATLTVKLGNSYITSSILCMERNEINYKIITYATYEDAYLERNATLYSTLFTEIIIFITMLIMVYRIVEKKMIKPIHLVNKGLEKITKGDLSTKIRISSSEEFVELSKDLNKTVSSLKDLIEEAEHKNEKELELAKEIQSSAVPSSFPAFPKRKDIDIFALMNTAKEVGGDFYDFYFIDENKLAFLIADVSGKGIPAAMFMMASKTMIKGLAESGKNIEEVFMEANKKLCESNEAEMFLTSWMGILDLETGILTYSNAGHNPPLIYRNNNEFTYIKDKPNFIMAGLSSAKYVRHELKLNPGDKIYLYTDGVTEAENINHELYGEDRLIKKINEIKEKDPTSICKDVLTDVKEYVNEAPQSDDITMVAFKLNYLQSSNSITVYPDENSLTTITDFVDNKLSKLNISSSIRNKVEIAVDEIFSNIQKYGEANKATISFKFENDKLAISFIDDGYPFDPLAKEDPNITLKASERKIGGLGIYLVKKLSSSINYENKDGLNILYVEFDLKNSRMEEE